MASKALTPGMMLGRAGPAFSTGLASGQAMPDFTLPDHTGGPVNFRDARAGRRALVHFFRSTVWCPSCATQLVELQEHHAEYQREDIAVFAICPEPVGMLAEFASRNNITYPLLSDQGSRLIGEVGILNVEVPAGDPVYGMPYPGSYLLDEHGIVFEKRFHPDFHVREPMGSLLLYFRLKEYSEKLEQKVQERTMQLIETAKLATLGKLIAAINHEMNTPLGALANGMDLLWKYLETVCSHLDPRRREALEEVRRAVEAAYQRINQVMGDLRQFIRLEQAEMQAVDLRQSLDAALELLGSRLDGRIRVERQYGEIPTVAGYAPQINQALWELLSNAVDAIDGQGVVTVVTRGDTVGVEVTIADTGRGIPEAELDQVFEPRLRPKRGRMGVSLGLPLAHKVVHDHGGRLQITSRVGQGTTVTLRLPLQAAAATP